MKQARNSRINVAAETKHAFPHLLRTYGDVLEPAIKATQFYTTTDAIDKRKLFPEPVVTKYRVFDEDTPDVARRMIQDENLQPCVLNLASERRPGGGWDRGARAQEEDLFLRSTYDMSLSDSMQIDTERSWLYPIPKTGGIYSPKVLVFRDNEASMFKFLKSKQCFFVDFVAVPALRTPPLTSTGDMRPADKDTTKEKIRAILRIAALNGHRSVLLGALGCGAFANPPRVIARLFHDIVTEPEFSGIFTNVDFAILDCGTGNFSVFREELSDLL